MGFVQTIAIRTGDVGPVRDLMDGWHADQGGVAPGYVSHRLLADRDDTGRYVIEVEFDSAESAAKNNDRAETAAWAGKLSALIDGDAEFVSYDEMHRSG